MTIEAEIGVVQLQATGAIRNQRRQGKESVVELLKEHWPGQHLDFGPLASRTLRE